MKKLFIGLIGLLFLLFFVGLYLYNKPTEDISSSDTDITITAARLFQEFSENEERANKEYLDKIIEVEGVIKEMSSLNENPSILLQAGSESFGVLCSFEKAIDKKLRVGERIVVKGLCTGMLTDVVLIGCSMEE